MSDQIKTPELEAIDKLQEGVNEFKKQLSGKVDADKFQAVQTEMETMRKNLDEYSEKDFDGQLDMLNKAIEELNTAMEDVSVKMEQEKMRTAGRSYFPTKEAIEGFMGAMKARKAGAKLEINTTEAALKAAENFGDDQTFYGFTDFIHVFTGSEVDSTLYQAKRKKNFMLDGNFPIVPISVPRLFYMEKRDVGSDDSSTAGAADWILSGGAKPQRSFRLKAVEAKAKKIAIFGTIEDELLTDVPSFNNWIRTDFSEEMLEHLNYGLAFGDDVSNPEEIEGITLNATTFSATTGYANAITAPSYIDMIMAIAAKFASLEEMVDAIYVSEDVYYLIHHLKGTDGHFLNNNLVYISNGELFIAGIPVRMASSSDIASGYFLAVNYDAFKIRSYGNMTIESGLNASDFQYDRTSYRAYQRFITYLPTHRRNGVMYDTWANVESAITAP